MGTIRADRATVYVGNGRRYLTLKAACRAEARGIWKRMMAASGDRLEDCWDRDAPRIERVAQALSRRFRRHSAPAPAEKGETE